jgi:hypothetical protein
MALREGPRAADSRETRGDEGRASPYAAEAVKVPRGLGSRAVDAIGPWCFELG